MGGSRPGLRTGGGRLTTQRPFPARAYLSRPPRKGQGARLMPPPRPQAHTVPKALRKSLEVCHPHCSSQTVAHTHQLRWTRWLTRVAVRGRALTPAMSSTRVLSLDSYQQSSYLPDWDRQLRQGKSAAQSPPAVPSGQRFGPGMSGREPALGAPPGRASSPSQPLLRANTIPSPA